MTRAENITQLRKQLDPEFNKRFFSTNNRRFFGDTARKWDKKRQVLVITRVRDGQTTKVEYVPELDEDGELILRVNRNTCEVPEVIFA